MAKRKPTAEELADLLWGVAKTPTPEDLDAILNSPDYRIETGPAPKGDEALKEQVTNLEGQVQTLTQEVADAKASNESTETKDTSVSAVLEQVLKLKVATFDEDKKAMPADLLVGLNRLFDLLEDVPAKE